MRIGPRARISKTIATFAIVLSCIVTFSISKVLAQGSDDASGFMVVNTEPVSIEETDQILRERIPDDPAFFAVQFAASAEAAAAAGCDAESPHPIEITALAKALKCDPDLIFEYVYNNIEYEPLFGSNKGALGTLLDQRGNDIDQAQLFTALLSAAGIPSSTYSYRYGYVRRTGTFVANWLGVKNDRLAIPRFLANGGLPTRNVVGNSDGTLQSIDIAQVSVYVQIGGSTYIFEPALKQHTISAGLANVGSVLGYTQTQFLADAGGTIDATSISNVNRAAVRNNLVTYANNLIKHIAQQNPAWTAADVVGGKRIQYATNLPRRQTVSNWAPSQPAGFPQNWGSVIPNGYRACFTISMPGVTPTQCGSASSQTIQLYADETYGKRITIFSTPSGNAYVPTLLVDGAPPTNGQNTGTAASAGQPWTFSVSIIHPYASTFANQTRLVTIRAGGSYLLGAGWGQVSRGMVEKHRQTLAQALAAPSANPASEQILGESLAVMSYSYLAQRAAQQRLTDQLARTATQYHHGLGIIAQTLIQSTGKQGPYVDLPFNVISLAPQTCWPSCSSVPPIRGAAYSTASVLSALESAVIEQTQPLATAASTITLIDMNAAAVAKTFFADGTTAAGVTTYQNSIRPNLSGYSVQDLQAINNAIYNPSTGAPTGRQVVIPANGNIQVGQWQGAGYTIMQETATGLGVTQRISGGLSGGFSGTPVPTNELTDNTSQSVVPPPAVPDVPLLLNGQTQPSNPTISDPVDSITGAYIYKNTDLVIGSDQFPYALPFERTYRSSSNLTDIGLGRGWTHNYSFKAKKISDPYEGLAATSPVHGAPAIAALHVLQDLFDGPRNAQVMTVSSIVTRWLTDQLTANAVTVSTPDTTEQFIKRPQNDDVNVYDFGSPFGSGNILSGTGTTYIYTTKDRTRLTFVPTTSDLSSTSILSAAFANGMTINLAYDGSGRLATVTNNLGRILTLGYSGKRVSSVSDGTGRSVAFSYSDTNLTNAADPLQFVTSYNYDGASRLTQIFYPSNPTNPFITNTYDGLGRVNQQANANGHTATFYIAGSRSELINPAGDRQVTYQTRTGKVIKDAHVLGSSVGNIFNDTIQQNGLVNISTSQYDGQDRLTLAKAPEGGTVAYAYSPDLKHNVVQITRTPKPGSPLAPLITTASYDPVFNKPTMVTDPRGLVTTMSYDGFTGNLMSSVADDGSAPHFNAKTTYSYNAVGQVVAVTDPISSVTQVTYDNAGNRVSVTRDVGPGRLNQLTATAYNVRGDVISVTDPNGTVTTNTYDAARRPSATISPAAPGAPNGIVTTFSRDADGRVLQTQQSANGAVLRTTSTTYTLTEKPATSTDANGNVTSYAYDTVDRLSSTTDAMGRTTSYAYDAMSRQTKVFNTAVQANPLLQQSYRPDGPVASLIDANNNATTLAYDGFNRLATMTYPLGSTETFTYDADSNVISRKTRANQTIAFAYDTLNRLITKTPPAAPVVSYGYDLTGRLTSVSDTGAAIAAAVPPGAAPSMAYATSFTYDSLNRPTAVNWNPAPPATSPTVGTSVAFAYTYNKANQRTGQTTTDNSWWEYPAAVPSTVSYTADTLNRYTAVGAVTPTYNINGNLTGDGSFTFGYDAENRLTSANGAGNTATYAYDAQGRRKWKTVNGVRTVFVTDADNREVLEYDGSSGQILRWYAYGLGSNNVLNQINVAADTRGTFIADQLGSITATLDGNTGALTTTGYLPYGGSATATGTFRFTGQRIDPETNGLHYYRARMYKPAWGRFMQPDPIGTRGGINMYAYVGNDPLNLVDLLGLAPDSPQTGGPGAFENYLSNSAEALSRAPSGIAGMMREAATDPLQFLQRVGPSIPGLGLSIPVGSLFAAGAQETTTLFRAVSTAELNSIRSTGAFSNSMGIETKYFSTTLEGARSYAAQAAAAFGEGPFAIVQSGIRSRLITTEMRVSGGVDRGISTVTVPTELLPKLSAPRVLSIP